MFRILFVCSARKWGGNEKWSAMAMNALVTRGHSVFLLVRRKNIWIGRVPGVTIFAMPFFFHVNPFTYLGSFVLLRRMKINRIISTKRAEYFVMGLLSRFLGIRHLIRLGIVREVRGRCNEWIYRRLNDGIIVNAKRIRSVLLENPVFSVENIRVIYNGIPDILASSVCGINCEDRPFRVISVGMLRPRKGFDILIEALAILPDMLKGSTELVLVGEGPSLPELKSLAQKLGVENQVIFTGFRENPGIEMVGAHLFALISDNEGISNSLLEAMVRGVPVLTTSAGGTNEFLENDINGFIVERKPIAVAESLISLMERNDLKTIGFRGRDTARTFFSLERMTSELESFIGGRDL